MQKAIDHLQKRQLLEAKAAFKKVLKAKPKNTLALQGLGQIELSVENYSGAVELFEKALKSEPKNSGVLNDKGSAHLHLSQGNEALECFTKAVQFDPNNIDAYFNLASLLRDHRPAESLNFFNICIQKRPNDYKSLTEAGTLMRRMGNLEGAHKALVQALKIKPDFAAAFNQLGRVFYDAKKMNESIDCFKNAILSDPKAAEGYSNLTVVLIELDRMHEGLDIIDQALKRDPTMPQAHNNKGVILRAMGRIKDAMSSYKKAIANHPDYHDAYTNLANCYQDRNEPDKALDTLHAVLSRNPDFGQALYNICFPYFMTGQLEAGWDHYEYRFLYGKTLPNRQFQTATRWNGQDLTNKSILVWREQGIGDEFGFASCMHDLIAENPTTKVIYETEKRLLDVMQRSFPKAHVRLEQCKVDGTPVEQAEDYDFHIPVGSLPGVYRRSYDDFPEHSGFLTPDPALVEDFKDRIQSLGNGLKIGICWRSGLEQVIRGGTNTSIEKWWGDILSKENCQFINLQYGDYEHELVAAEQATGVNIHRWSDVDLKTDIEKVFAIIQNCDLVITPTTTVAHMSGSLNIPTFVISWEGYWPLFGTLKKPYYPSQKFFLTSPTHPNRMKTMQDVALAVEQSAKAGDAWPVIHQTD